LVLKEQAQKKGLRKKPKLWLEKGGQETMATVRNYTHGLNNIV